MWYEKAYRRHLCDMHIEDWNPEFLSEFSAEKYFENLKKAKIQNAMIYLQSHVGLCNFPTKSGKMHNGFKGKEYEIKKLVDLCRKDGISVTGYYSLIYNNVAHDYNPEWRMVNETGKSKRESSEKAAMSFAENDLYRYGLCCPNNMEYRKFTSEQIKEMSEIFTLDGMFFDMLFWPHICHCESCKKRWADEVGGEMPVNADWNDEKWLFHIEKRRQWMGEFAMWAANEAKKYFPGITVEHNMAFAAMNDGTKCNGTEVNESCDYAGGDLYGGIKRHSLTCKFYRNFTKNQPFEYMFSRCEPNLSKHTTMRSEDVMRSSFSLVAAHHGATLIIDAIDPKGTMDERVYERTGKCFDKLIPYEKYYKGELIEDIGIYYSMKSKFNPQGEAYTNHSCMAVASDTFIDNGIPYGITGIWHDISKYKIIVAPMLTEEDRDDFERIETYVKNGGNLYISGGNCTSLIKKFFGAEVLGRTKEKIVYYAPEEKYQPSFDYFNKDYPLQMGGKAVLTEGIEENKIIAKITLPYTNQDELKFASIHSNPPGIKTDIPGVAVTSYGNGKVLWSAIPVEFFEHYDYKRIFINLINDVFKTEYSVISDAPKNVEIISFREENAITVSTVLLNEEYEAPLINCFEIKVKTEKKPCSVILLPEENKIDFEYENGYTIFKTRNLDIFDMYKINL